MKHDRAMLTKPRRETTAVTSTYGGFYQGETGDVAAVLLEVELIKSPNVWSD